MIARMEPADTVAATITATAAAVERWQAIVIGAGPAGSAVAWRLAAAGLRVILVDRHAFPRGKVCGCCLSARALDELRSLGDGGLPEDAVPLATVRLAHRGRSVGVPLPAGRVVSRERLDAAIVRRAIAAGSHWLPHAVVQAIDERCDDGCAVALREADATTISIQAELAVVATGLADHVRVAGGGAASGAGRVAAGSRLGVGAVLPAEAGDLPGGELVMAVGRDGYCGLVRLDDGRIDVAAALDRTAVARDATPARTVAHLLDEAFGHDPWPVRADAILAASFRATPPLTRRAPLVAGESRRILRVGDAAGYVEPFTGEGIGWALTSARILAAAVVAPRGLRTPADIAARYVAAHHRELEAVHARCRLVARGLRRPVVVATAVTAARAAPWAARRIVPLVVGAAHGGGGP